MYTTVSGGDLMPRVAKDTGPTDSLQTRLTAAETERWTEMLKRAFSRDPRATRSDVARVLLGFADARGDLLTKQEVAYFRGEVKALRADTEAAGQKKPGTIPLMHVGKPKASEKKQA